jgi:hypothetical protein
MSISRFYPSKQSAQIGKDIWFKSFDMHVSMYEWEGEAVYEVTTTDFTPTPAVTWTIDDYKSSQKKNFFFVDDAGDLCSVKIDSNTATKLVVTIANAKKCKDGATAAAVTDGATYTCYVLTPNNYSEHGDFFGYTQLSGLTPGVEKVPLVTGTPEVKIRTDIGSHQPVLKGVSQCIGEATLKTLMRLKEYGLQTGYTSLYTGQDIDIGGFWEITLVSKTVEAKSIVGHIWRTNLSLEGDFNIGEKAHKTIGFLADVLQSPYVEDAAAALYGWVTED